MTQQRDKIRNFLLTILKNQMGLSYKEVFSSLTTQECHKLIDTSRKHHISPLLYQYLKTIESQVPPEILQTFRTDYFQNAIRNLELYRNLADVLKSLHQAHIPIIPFKGLFLAEHVYKNIAARSMSDVDLLVKREELDRARDILLKFGFNPMSGLDQIAPKEYQLSFYHSKSNLILELHWLIINPKHRVHLNTAALWERSLPSQISGVPVRILTAEDQILQLCMHASDHVFGHGLRAMVDIKKTLLHYDKEIDWTLLSQRALEWGVTRSLFVNLWLAKKLLNAPVPDLWLNSNKVETITQNRLEFSEECLFMNAEEPETALPETDNLILLWKEESFLKKIVLIWNAFFPSRLYLSVRYPIPPNSWRIYLYYPIRIKDLLRKRAGTLWALIRGDKSTVQHAEVQNELLLLKNWLFSA